jgi:hypothetical protein
MHWSSEAGSSTIVRSTFMAQFIFTTHMLRSAVTVSVDCMQMATLWIEHVELLTKDTKYCY